MYLGNNDINNNDNNAFSLRYNLGNNNINNNDIKGPIKAVVVYKIAPNRFKTTYRSVLTFEEKKQSITHLFKTFSGLRLGCNAFILAKRSENTVN